MNITMNRRLRNESRKWIKDYQHQKKILCLKTDNADKITGVHLYFTELGNMKDVFFEMLIDGEYPFSPPKVFYVPEHRKWKISILKIYRLSYHGRKEMESISEYVGCLCCHSLICKDNWAPIKNMMDVADEIEIIMLLRQRIVDRILCRIMFNKLGLPIDLMRNILTYI